MSRRQRISGERRVVPPDSRTGPWVGMYLLVSMSLLPPGCAKSSPGPGRSYEGSSSKLARTAVVPTLDTPVAKGVNVIWCASFQMAWDRLRQDVIRQPVGIAGAEAVTERLNSGTFAEDDLPPGSFYAAAGRSGQDLTETIRREMAGRFPGTRIATEFPDDGLLAFAYLRAAAKFTRPYFDRRGGIEFKDSAGKTARVSGFGLFETESVVPANEELAGQVRVLYVLDDEKDPLRPAEFALDLDRNSHPCQVIVAKVPLRETLAATIAHLGEKTDQQAKKEEIPFSSEDGLAVPDLNWKTDHRFAELEGEQRRLLNPGFQDLWVVRAQQIIEFRLDKSGAAVASESNVYAGAIPRHYHLDGPFLILMQKRGAPRPFFAMWVDNAELLCKRDAGRAVPETSRS